MGTFITSAGSGITDLLPDGEKTPAPGVSLRPGWTIDNVAKAAEINNLANGLLDAKAAIRGREFNVKNYGAVGNGTTDDTAAVQAAVDAAEAAGGGHVTAPPTFICKVTSTITIQADAVHLHGPWTLYNSTAGGTQPTLHIQGNASTAIKRCHVVGMKFDSSSSGNGHIKMSYANECHIVRNVFETCNGDAIQLSIACWENHIADNVFESIGGSAVALGANSNGVVVRQNRMHACSGSGVKLTGNPIYGASIIGNAIEGNRDEAILVDGAASVWALNIEDNYLEANSDMSPAGPQIHFETVTTGGGVVVARISGNLIDGGTVATYPATFNSGTNIWYGHNYSFRHATSNSPTYASGAAVDRISIQDNNDTSGLRLVGHSAGNRTASLTLENKIAGGKKWELASGIAGTSESYLGIRNATDSTNIARIYDTGQFRFMGAIVAARVTPAYGASIDIDAKLGNEFVITATNGSAFAVNAPTNGVVGQRISVRIRNTSGGALGAVTWNAAFKMAAWTQPGSANSRSIDFQYDGTNWIEAFRTPADVPN